MLVPAPGNWTETSRLREQSLLRVTLCGARGAGHGVRTRDLPLA